MSNKVPGENRINCSDVKPLSYYSWVIPGYFGCGSLLLPQKSPDFHVTAPQRSVDKVILKS